MEIQPTYTQPAVYGVFDAKMHFSALVERAHNGETIVITKHGQPMATLGNFIPIQKPRMSLEEVQAAFAAFRATQKPLPAGETVTDWVRKSRDEQAAKWE